MQRRLGFLSLSALIVCAFTVPGIAEDASTGGIPDRTSAMRLVRSIPTGKRGILHPSGLAFSNRSGAFLVLDATAGSDFLAPPRETLTLLTTLADPAGSLVVPTRVPNARNMAVDPRTQRLLALDERGRVLVEARLARGGPLRRAHRFDLSHLGIQNPQGMTVDPRTGTLFILDALSPHIVRIAPDARRGGGAARLSHGLANHLDLGVVGASELQGIAFNPADRHLYVLSPGSQQVFELTEMGEPVAFFDLSSVALAAPGAMVFAPSGDNTDDPLEMSLYIADAGSEDGARRGRIVELSLRPPRTARVAPLASPFRASVVRTIATSRFSPPSPDAMGLAYDPAANTLVMVDSEVEEVALYAGVNVWEMSVSGTVVRTYHTRAFSDEPAGIAIDSARGIWYISDDDLRRVFVVELGSDRRFRTSDDRVTSFDTRAFGNDDPEGISFDPVSKHLFLVSGLGTEVYELSPGSNGRFEGSDDVLVRHWDTAQLGLSDPESVEVNPDERTLYIASRGIKTIFETTFSGTVVREIDTSSVGGSRPSGLAYAPASNGSTMHLYISDRGADNDGNPTENDGQIFEITLPTSAAPPGGGGGGTSGGGGTGGMVVAASSDDAEESASRSVSLNSGDLELVLDSDIQTVGLRFNGLAVPRGASISRAWIQFHADETHAGPTHLTIFGQNVDNAATFTSSTGNVSSRPRTSSVTWAPPAWTTVGEAGEPQKTTDLAPILREIVNRTGWASGNSVAFIFTGTGRRTAVSFDGDPAGAPVLYVELAAPNQPPSVSAGSNQTVTLAAGANLNGTVSDDGLPSPPGRTTAAWTQVTGPGAATFGNTASVDTTASFSAPGAYVLRLTVTDGELSRSDDVSIDVRGSSTEGTATSARIGSGTDDAEESSSGSTTLTSSDLELVHDSSDQTVGLRFNGINVPRGATILGASIQFEADETQSEATSLTIVGQKVDSATTFTSSSGNISSRPRTSASVPWSPDPWGSVGDAGLLQQTPDLSSIVQEIVNRSGWTSGGSMAFIIRGTGHRTATAYEGNPAGAPTLAVAYSSTAANQAPVVNAGPDQSLASPQTISLAGSATDDGLPDPPGALTRTWTSVSGPAAAGFANPGSETGAVTFPVAGTYVLRLTADDGARTSFDEVTMTVGGGSPGPGSIEARIRAGGDDAEESASGSMSLTSSDLELVHDGSDQKVGLRFTGLSIPQGATIVNAYVQFTADEVHTTPTSLTIEGQAADNPGGFTSASSNVSSRPKVPAAVTWSPVSWSTIGQAADGQRTPDLKTIVQAIVNRPGWSSGNALVLIITGTGHRTAEAYEGSAPEAPLLHLEYQ